ncbi:class I SAM-dependent methyltransferase [Streptomyces morookaense]|uniref:Class I SAM-dependent methyltransferase n=1 Tax=Streptomyces morookaense TaxID=1970 RepID=A0A7Y7B599_STRMO|nr:class I SAM-dependent methyltransferase [Streptomyces morookaense]NVK79135.1 class I SAM-dependent methyltransferase [Streptomyces morookaense]GHF28284.1 hypothetical protein GCM10010359_33390 [Streptomyces morookaense]
MTDTSTADIQQLIAGAGDTPRALRRAVDHVGPARAAELAVEEIRTRIDVPVNPHEIRVGLRIEHDGYDTATDRTLTLTAGRPVRVDEGMQESCEVRIVYRLKDLVRELWGPDLARTAGTRRIELATAHDTDFPPRELQPSIASATSTVIDALSPRTPDLGTLALRHGSDKWGQVHWFTPHYERHFAPLRDTPVRILEIGVGGYADEESGGGSLKMWRRYFRRGTVFGLDYFDKSALNGPRLQILQGDQNDPAGLDALAREHGPFDIIIDDGSHINEHVRTSFTALFPHLRPGGFYVIEDLWTSYLPGYGGDDRDLNAPHTMMGLLKSLIDDLHHEERESAPDRALSQTEAFLTGMHVYHNIAFLEKGVNAEGGIPRWMPRAPHW